MDHQARNIGHLVLRLAAIALKVVTFKWPRLVEHTALRMELAASAAAVRLYSSGGL